MATAKKWETLLLVDKVDRDHLKRMALDDDRTMKNTAKRIIKRAYNARYGEGSYDPNGVEPYTVSED